MKTINFFALILIFFSSVILSQEKLTGNLKQDFSIAFNETNNSVPQFTYQQKTKKSPLLAGLFSALIPGAGEIYSEEYLKAGIFLAIEAALITTAVIYENKGDDQTTKFEGYADQEWSVVKYAEWLNEHKNKDITIDPNTSLPPWERVDWAELNEAESDFSHRLPQHGEQQYYELIGKYAQYSSGWSEFLASDNDYYNVPNQLLFYADMRGEANDYYNVSSKAVVGLYINHILSAVDAVWSASVHNKDIAVNVRVQNIIFADINELIPVINLKYSF